LRDGRDKKKSIDRIDERDSGFRMERIDERWSYKKQVHNDHWIRIDNGIERQERLERQERQERQKSSKKGYVFRGRERDLFF